MAAQSGMRRRRIRCGMAAALALSLLGALDSARAFTDQQAREIFDTLDPGHSGQVTPVQFEQTKMNAFFYNRRPDKSGSMAPLTYEDTELSRAFFDKIDQNHDGQIDSIEMMEAVRFEDIDTRNRGYFDFADLAVFLQKIGR